MTEVLKAFLDDENDIVMLMTLMQMREMHSEYIKWLTYKRITLQRIIRDRRITLQGFVDSINHFCSTQFSSFFRMAPSTFEVIEGTLTLCTYRLLFYHCVL